MGRGTAILRYGSALHSRRLPGPSAQRLFGWLEGQLEMRGVDPAVYSRYLISLLQLDDAEFERSEVSDQELDPETGASGLKRSGKRSKRKKQQNQQQQEKPTLPTDSETHSPLGLFSGVSSRKRAAAVQCLRSACSDPYELGELIDELCYRLRRLNAASSGGLVQQQPQSSNRLPLLAEEEDADEMAATAAASAAAADAADEEDSGTAAYVQDSGQAGTPEEFDEPGAGAAAVEAVTEDYVCAFPALADALNRGRQAAAVSAGGVKLGSGRLVRSAWARGPPRSLRHLRQRQLRRKPSRPLAGSQAPPDEGFLDEFDDDDDEDLENDAEWAAADEAGRDPGCSCVNEGGDVEEDDAVSVASEGSEILQLVSHILHSFNREIEDELAAAAAAAACGAASGVSDFAASERIGEADPLALIDLPDTNGVGLLNGMSLMEDEAELLSDHDFDNLPSQEDEEEMPQLQLPLLDTDENYPDDSESVNSALVAAGSSSSSSASACHAAVAKPTVAMATGIVTLPADLVLSRMADWTALDRLRCRMWSRKPLPPKPQPQPLRPEVKLASPTSPARRQPMTPLEKSKRACSFLLRGRCKKEDCEFAHDLNRVVCKFWSAGECFKGDTCLFLHGSPQLSDAEDLA